MSEETGGLLPANRTARNKEIANRLARMEQTLDQALVQTYGGMALATPLPPPDPLNSLKRRIASDEVRLPGTMHCAWDHEDQLIVEAIDYNGVTFMIEDLIRFKIMDAAGTVFQHDRAGRIVHLMREAKGEVHPGAIPGWD